MKEEGKKSRKEERGKEIGGSRFGCVVETWRCYRDYVFEEGHEKKAWFRVDFLDVT